MKKQIIKFLLFCFITPNAFAQDTTQVLRLDDLFAQIISFHPIAKQSQLLSETAKQEIRIARGFFDPVVSSKYYSKSFKGNNYFDLWDNNLRVPLWFGADLLAGYEKNGGNNINPEDYTPKSGLTSVGISLPISQGLIIDERRSTLRQAQLFSHIAEAEKVKILNKLLLEASKQYWDWALNYEKLKLNRKGLELGKFRLEAVKVRAIQGDLASIDSVEAQIQVQNFEVAMQQAEVDYINSSLLLSNYLWKEDFIPVEITSGIVPSMEGSEIETIQKDSLDRLLNLASANHPELVKIEVKLKQLEIERRFYSDKLKPKLNLEYNILNTGFSLNDESFNSGYLSNNYKIGISFAQPLFLRRERGKLQLNKLKIQETRYSFQQSNREILNVVTASYNEWVSLENQIRSQQGSVRNYEILREGEQQRFENGESSLFIVNQREASLIANQIKLAELRSKYAKNKIFLQWAAGSVAPVLK